LEEEPVSPRADALRNRERVLTAAREAFAADGPSVSLDDIARRAGVGPGTVHRNFPSKKDLLTAVITDRMQDLTAEALRLGDTEDTGAAFFTFFHHLASQARENLALTAAVTLSEELLHDAAVPLEQALGALLAQAQRDGHVRPDLSIGSLHALMAGALLTEQRLEPAARGLGLKIIADGLRAR
jgi:AcrR family transcriptional regulator